MKIKQTAFTLTAVATVIALSFVSYQNTSYNQGNALINIGTLGGNTSCAFAINDRDEVVGEAETADGASHAFLWKDGHIIDLGCYPSDFTSPGVALLPSIKGLNDSSAMSINDNDQIVGQSSA